MEEDFLYNHTGYRVLPKSARRKISKNKKGRVLSMQAKQNISRALTVDITKKKFNKLTGIKLMKWLPKGRSRWLFSCECGKKKAILKAMVTSGHTRSCGCLKRINRWGG